MPAPVNIRGGKTRFSKLLSGITAALAPLAPETRKKRVPGIDKGKIWMAKDFNSMSKRDLDDWIR